MERGSFIKKKKGSSSIMVMMVMIALVIFGVLALMSSYSDYKLAKKNAAWISRYYTLDGEGQQFISQIETAIKQTQVKTNALDKVGLSRYSDMLKAKILGIKTYNSIKLEQKNNIITVYCEIGEKSENKLSVKLEIDLTKLLVTKNIQGLLRIVEWKQMASEFKYNNVNQLWNGEVGKP